MKALHFDLTDQYRPRRSPIHSLDPRVKVVAVLSYVLALGLMPAGAWTSFILCAALALACAWASRLGLTFALRRSYIALPFLVAALPVPLTTPGDVLCRLPGLGWAVTEPGVVRFVSISFRSWLAVQAAILLTATTQFPDLLWALSALRMPKPLVATVGFMYRYLYVLADEALRMLRARAARSAVLAGNPRPPVGWQGSVAGNMVGSLFLRALERSERVYAAMVSRGYNGSMRSLVHFSMRPADWIALAAVIVLLAAIVLGGG